MRSIIVSVFLTVLLVRTAVANTATVTFTFVPYCPDCPEAVREAVQMAPAPESAESDKSKPRKPRVKKPACDCTALTAERDGCNAQRVQLESDLAVARTERDAAKADLETCTDARDTCAADLAAVEKRITDAEVEIEKLRKAAEDAAKAKPAPPPPAATQEESAAPAATDASGRPRGKATRKIELRTGVTTGGSR